MSETSEISSLISSYIAITIKVLEGWDFAFYDLWESCTEAFEGYTEDDFKLATNASIRELRDFLRGRGVWVEKGTRTPIAKALCNTLLRDDFIKWPENETWPNFAHSSELQFPNAALCADQLAKEKAVREYWKFRDHQEISLTASPSTPLASPPAAPLAAPPQEMPRPMLSFSAISEISILPVQSSAPQQSSLFQISQPTFAPRQQSQVQQTSPQPTPSNLPQLPQPPIQPTSQQPSARTPPTSSRTTTFLITPHTPSYAAPPFINPTNPQAAASPLISPTPPQAATVHDKSFHITSGCISYKKGMG